MIKGGTHEFLVVWHGNGGGRGGGTVAAGTPLPDNILVECQSRVS